MEYYLNASLIESPMKMGHNLLTTSVKLALLNQEEQ